MAETMPNPEQNQNGGGENEWDKVKEVPFAGTSAEEYVKAHEAATGEKINIDNLEQNSAKAEHMADAGDKKETQRAVFIQAAEAAFNGDREGLKKSFLGGDIAINGNTKKAEDLTDEEMKMLANHYLEIAERKSDEADKVEEQAGEEYDDFQARLQRLKER